MTRTQWKKALDILESVPESRRMSGGYYEDGDYCPVSALAMAIRPTVEDALAMGEGMYEAKDIVRVYFNLDPDMIVSTVDDPKLDRLEGWRAVMSLLMTHSKVLKYRF